jgi:hypothetical protein
MRQIYIVVGALVLLALLAGCSPAELAVATPTPAPAATDTPSPSPTFQPSDTPTPESTATWVPTVTPPPPAAIATAEATAIATPTPDAQILASMDAIEAEVEALRGLDLSMPLTRTVMTRQELAAYLEDEFAQDYAPEDIEADVQVLAAFDFVDERFDLQQVLLDLYSAEILGLYDDELDVLYIVSDGEFDLSDELTVAHEYVHGLQDQNLGLNAFLDDDSLNDDQYLARLSLVEGDASLAMVEYLWAHLSEFDAGELQEFLEEEQGSDEVLAAAPPIIRETFAFPYLYGLDFVTVLQEEGWDAVDAAYLDPPQSSEQILHPDKYLLGDKPELISLAPLTSTLGTGWHLVEAETLGEFQTHLYLVQQLDQETADLASQGWDGDRYAVYTDDDALLLVFATAWDSPADREEFVSAYQQYAENKYGQRPTRAAEAELWWETPVQAAVLTWGRESALIVLGPDLEIVARALAVVRP